MNVLMLRDIGESFMQISLQKGNGDLEEHTKKFKVDEPLAPHEYEEIRWYLENYLDSPYSPERIRAERVENTIRQSGQALFKKVFSKGASKPDPYTLYQKALEQGPDKCEICIVSNNPAFLGIPWEIMRDAELSDLPLAVRLKGFYRCRSDISPREIPDRSGSPYRILLVITRPSDAEFLPFFGYLRPILNLILPLRPAVQVELMRPFTFAEFKRRLQNADMSYDLVQFDGHGRFIYEPTAKQRQRGAEPNTGHLLFEHNDGGIDYVGKQRLQQALKGTQVPPFILSACQSDFSEVRAPFASIASRLLQLGAPGVVAMSHRIQSSATEFFSFTLYEKLFSHASLSEAVSAARKVLYENPERGAPIGVAPLQDWVIPRLYLQVRAYTPLPPRRLSSASTRLSEKTPVSQDAGGKEEWGCDVLIGRDMEIMQIERALQTSGKPFVHMTGVFEVGKSTLA